MNILEGKYQSMNDGGVDKLLSGQFDMWQGLPAKDAPNFILAAHFEPSQALDDVMQTLSVAAAECGISLSLAGRNYPFHVTIQQGTPGDQSRPLPNVVKRFDLLRGMTFRFEQVIAGPNLLLASSQIPAGIANCRETVSSFMTGCGLTPAPISILHATAARITNVLNARTLPEFVLLVSSIRHRVLLRPLELTVSHLSFGTVGELLQQPVAA